MMDNIDTEVSKMANLQESPIWVDGIYQLTDETPVLGKQENVTGDGPANLQAQQLANRTQYLKWISDSLQNAVYVGGSGVSLYSTEAVLRASVPADKQYLAIDQSTGRYFVWDTSVIPLQDETTTYLARLTTQPTAIQKAAINRLYYDLKRAGILSKLDGLWVGISTSRADATLNLVGLTLTLNENGNISYNAESGWTFHGNDWLDTGFVPAVADGHFVRDSASFGVLVAGKYNSGVFMGAYDGSSGLTLSRKDNLLNGRINNSQLLSGAISPTGTTLFSLSRTDKNSAKLYSGNRVVAIDQTSSFSLINSPVSIGRGRDSSGWYTSSNICVAFIGSGLGETEIFSLNDAIQRYIHTFRQSVSADGVWVQTQFSLLNPDSVESISSEIVAKKTALLSNVIITYSKYSDISATTADSPYIRALDESTGVIYEPSDIPDAVLSETTAFIARMTTIPDAVQQVALNQLIYLLKKDGVWDALEGLWLGVSTSYADSLLNVVKNKFNLTSDNAPSWNQSGGWTFSRSGMTWLDTGFNPSLAAGKFALEDASFGALLFPPAGMTATGHIMGAFNGTDGMALAPRPSQATSSPMAVRLNQGKAYMPGDYPVANAVYGVSRLNGELAVYREGLLLGSTTQTATALTNSNVLLGCSQKTTGYHMFDGAIGAAWVGASLTAKQMLTLTNAIRRYNDVFRSRMSPDASWWSPTDRRMYSQADIIAIAGSKTGSSVLEPPASEATVSADISLALSEQGQTYRGGYIEIQPDSFIGGTEPATDSTTELWGFPHSLTLSEQNRLRSMMLPGNGYGIHYIRLPLGFAYRGFRNIDTATGLAKNIGERYAGQNAGLKRLMANIVDAGGGLAPEYWCPAPYWMTNGKYAGTPSAYNQPWAGGSYPRKTTLDSIKGSDPEQYAAQIDAMSDAMLNDFEYLHQNVGPVRMYGLQNEPQYGHELYGVCKYTDRVYSDLLAALQPKIAASAILSEWEGQENTPLLHVASDNDWHIGQTYIEAHPATIWGYSHHNITAIATDADWLKSSTFINQKGGKKNVFVNETEYMHPENSSNAWKCANNMLRDVHNLTFGGAEVVMPVIHLCKQLGESTSYTSNTDGYAIMRCNLPQQYGVAPGASGNEDFIGYGGFGENAWNYNAYRLTADNLPVGSIRVGGQPTISAAGIGVAAFRAGGKIKLFLVNRNAGAAAITVSLGTAKTLAGRHYDLSHAGDALTSRTGSTITFVLPAYSGQCWSER
ncbi:hypothetical protein [Klebsiella michiganensis]|uniref:hypothetical protein n=1 Tax=Klebsiella michiganensis TaxID=1134687 RepID=UPI0027CB294D|nr:hypothetical protein [Klebsiella michiganensis]MDQ2143199.1 hypothetical protein [Klebsiella michiganensis]MDV6971179.1 hypothetical protein [Klebsiella michiganensis]MDW5480822.1 hypothetical protein [Klebsiella michiganensis]MDZ5706476.1 hypothetical protein [Klebsiella michiganensis]